MDKDKLKPHWERLIRLVEKTRNGKATFHWQDGLPIDLQDTETHRRHIDLTKEDTD